MSRRTLLRAAGALGLLALVVVVPGSADATSSAAFHKSVTASRTNLVNGKTVVVDRRTITVTVDTTASLRDRQGIQVAWSGAHPTGGVVADANSAAAASQEEYPVVLMECRGLDSNNAPKGQRLSPETCWTQTPSERFDSDFNTKWPTWRFDRYAAGADRGRYVAAPKPRPAQCFGAAEAERWLPFVAAGGHRYLGGPGGCAGLAPEATSVGTLSLPGNTTYAVTAANGRGAASFNVRTAESNASLGCSQNVPCSLVVVPIMGISCDAEATGLPPSQRPPSDELAAAVATCEASGAYAPGQPAAANVTADHAVTGSMWWSASNWRNRISVPLTFAPAASACNIVGRGSSVDIYGSELMTQASAQWAPVFCLDPQRTGVHHVQTGEPQAANLVKAGSIEAALLTDPPPGGFGRPVVMAPVAMTGFAVTYAIDGANGHAYTRLRLTPRLLAKLMTESYPAISAIKTDYAALANNPVNLAADPEFQALNPGLSPSVGTQAAATLLSLSSDSDVIYALTSYIAADPAARAWLNGAPDPWGMVVNPNYKGIGMPRVNWPLLDSFEPLSYYRPGVNDCLAQAPVPYLPLVAAPMIRLSQISLAMQFAVANSQVVCYIPTTVSGSLDGAKLVALGRQSSGFRFMIGITTLADAQRFRLDTAALQTQATASASDNLATDEGRTFVRPDASSLRAAAASLQPDKAGASWIVPYRQLQSRPADAQAYPGSMMVYAAIPTSGVASADAHAYADWIRYVSTTGQRPGPEVGKLPAGYLPMTAANGLGQQATYAKVAADAVAAQEGKVPALDATSYSANTGPSGNNGGTNSGGGTTNSGGGTTNSGGGTPNGSGPTPSGGSPSGSPAPVSLGDTVGLNASAVGMILPILLGVAVIAGLMIPVTLLRTRWRTK